MRCGIICLKHNDDETDTLPARIVLIRFDEIFDFIKFENLFNQNSD